MAGHRPPGALGTINTWPYRRTVTGGTVTNDDGTTITTPKRYTELRCELIGRTYYDRTDTKNDTPVKIDGWVAEAWVTDPWTGREVRLKARGGTITDAKNALARKHSDLTGAPAEQGEFGADTALRVIANAWHDHVTLTGKVGKRRVRLQSLQQYWTAYMNKVDPVLGDMRAGALTPARIEKVLDAVWELTPSRAAHARVALGHMLAWASGRGAPTRMAMLGVGSYKKDHHATDDVDDLADDAGEDESFADAFAGDQPVVLTPDAVKALRAHLLAWQAVRGRGPRRPQYLADLLDLMVATGCRPSEVLAFRWKDVDLDAGTVTITGTLVERTGLKVYRQTAPKSVNGYRTLVLPGWALAVVMRRSVDAASGARLVFPNRDGNPLSPRNVGTRWRNALAGTEWQGTARKHLRSTTGTTVKRGTGSTTAAAAQLGNSEAIARKHYTAKELLVEDHSALLDVFAPSAQNAAGEGSERAFPASR